ncbi:MAG: DUF4136 domain-containing protein [Bacteroidota bacterium]
MHKFIMFFLSIIAFASCARVFRRISYHYDHTVNFSAYKTYAWIDKNLPHSETPYDNEIVENNIKNYVEKEFEKKGYAPNDDSPDVLFELLLSDTEKVKTTVLPVYSYPTTSYRYFNAFNYGWNRHGYSHYDYIKPAYSIGKRVVKTPYNRSSITINVFDRKNNRLIWTGSAKGNVYDDNYRKKEIHPAIIKILNQYPIKTSAENKY